MVKGFVSGILIGVVLLVGSVWFYFTSGRAPVATVDPPMPFEKKLARIALHTRIDKDPHTDPAPVPANEATYLAGAAVYKQHFAVCPGLPCGPQTYSAQVAIPHPQL